ncbi:MAG: S8 family serine peptidase [Clostridia bacterium]
MKIRKGILFKASILVLLMLFIFKPAYPLEGNWWKDSLSFDELYAETYTSDLVIAILDTGASIGSMETMNVVHQYNAWTKTDNAEDTHGHGTWITSIIKDMVQARFMIIKITDQYNRSTPAILAEGILHAVENGADIINVSMETRIYSIELKNAVEAAIRGGCLVIASTGNNGSFGLSYPAAFPGVISVGSSDVSGNRAGFSNYGHGINLLAPGEYIQGIGLDGTDHISSGTSASTAIITGLIAMLKTSFPQLDNTHLKYLLSYSCDDIYQKGRDIYTGTGIINPSRLFENTRKLLENISFVHSQSEDLPWYRTAYDFGVYHKYVFLNESELQGKVTEAGAQKMIHDFFFSLYGVSPTFSGDVVVERITREAFVHLLLETDKVGFMDAGIDIEIFKDYASVSEQYQKAISYAFSVSLVNGRDNMHFYPYEFISHAEACQILYNYHMYKLINRKEIIDFRTIFTQPDYKRIASDLFTLYLQAHMIEIIESSLRITGYGEITIDLLNIRENRFSYKASCDVEFFLKEGERVQMIRYLTVEYRDGKYHIIDMD